VKVASAVVVAVDDCLFLHKTFSLKMDSTTLVVAEAVVDIMAEDIQLALKVVLREVRESSLFAINNINK
jgi:hypothetical protein